jgi:hypothetical protein
MYRSPPFGTGAAVADMPSTATALSSNVKGSAHDATEEAWTKRHTLIFWASISAMGTSPEADAMYSLCGLPAATIGQGSWRLPGERWLT